MHTHRDTCIHKNKWWTLKSNRYTGPLFCASWIFICVLIRTLTGSRYCSGKEFRGVEELGQTMQWGCGEWHSISCATSAFGGFGTLCTGADRMAWCAHHLPSLSSKQQKPCQFYTPGPVLLWSAFPTTASFPQQTCLCESLWRLYSLFLCMLRRTFTKICLQKR